MRSGGFVVIVIIQVNFDAVYKHHILLFLSGRLGCWGRRRGRNKTAELGTIGSTTEG